jgi:hypothetical protein
MKQTVNGLATRGQDSWLTSTQGLPDSKQALSMGKTWKQAQELLQQAAEMALKAPPGSVVIDLKLEDPELQALVDDVHSKRAVLRDAEFGYQAALGKAARYLTKVATFRDVAAMLGISHQYVAKLAPKADQPGEPGNTPEDCARMLYLVAGIRKPASTARLVREAKSWVATFPDDPEFAEQVNREHRKFIERMEAGRSGA